MLDAVPLMNSLTSSERPEHGARLVVLHNRNQLVIVCCTNISVSLSEQTQNVEDQVLLTVSDPTCLPHFNVNTELNLIFCPMCLFMLLGNIHEIQVTRGVSD